MIINVFDPILQNYVDHLKNSQMRPLFCFNSTMLQLITTYSKKTKKYCREKVPYLFVFENLEKNIIPNLECFGVLENLKAYKCNFKVFQR